MDSSIYGVEQKDDVAILTLTLGTVPVYEFEKLAKPFSEVLKKGVKKIVLDLSKTDYVSSVVLASFVYMLNKTKEAGGRFVLCSVNDNVKELLNITALLKMFEIYEDREAALQSL